MTTMDITNPQDATPFTEGSWPEVLSRPLRAAGRIGAVVLHAVTHPNPVPTAEFVQATEALESRRSPLER